MNVLKNKIYKFKKKLYLLIIFVFHLSIYPNVIENLNDNKLGEYILNKKEQMILKNILFDDYIVVLNGGKGNSNIPKNFVLVTSNNLQDEYEKNEVAGDIKYLDKTLVVTGDVKSINKTIGNKYFIEFKGDKYSLNNPKAFFKDGNKEFLASLNKGENITLICNGSGLNIGSAVLSQCISAYEWINSQINIDINKYININESMNEENFNYSLLIMAVNKGISKNSACYNEKLTKTSSSKCGKEFLKLINNKTKYEKSLKEVAELLKKLNINLKKIIKKST